MADGSLKFDTKIDTEGFKQGTNTLKGMLDRTISVLKRTGSSLSGAFADTGTIDGANTKIQALVREIEQYSDGLYYLEKQGLYFGDAEYDAAYQKLSRLENELGIYKKELSSVDGGQKKATSSAKRFGDSLKKTTKASLPLTKSIFKLSNMFKLLVLRMVMRSVIRSVQEGFQNLAQYSKQANKDMSALKTSMQTLQNSFATAFAPILTAITPALQSLINHLSQAITVMGQFFAVLFTGATTFTRAKDAQVDYAKSLKKSAKEAKKASASFDDLIILSDNKDSGGYEGPSPQQMFEDVDIDNKLTDKVEKLKDMLSPVIDAFDRLKIAVTPFAENVGGGLKWMYDNVLIPIGSWTISDLIPAFFDLLGSVIGVLNSVLVAFQPLGLWLWGNFLQPMAKWTGDAIITGLGLLTEGLNNLSDWILNNQELFVTGALIIGGFFLAFKIPALISALAPLLPLLSGLGSALGAILSPAGLIIGLIGLMVYAFVDLYRNSETFRESIAELGRTWMDALKPLADFIGVVLTDAWNKILKPVIDFFINTLLPNLIDTFKNLWENVLVPLGGFIGTYLAPVFEMLAELLTMLWNKVVLPLAEAVGEVLVKAWDAIYVILNKTIIPIIKKAIEVLKFLWEKVINPIIKVLWDNLKPAFETVFTGIGEILKDLLKALGGVIDFIAGVFTGDWSKAWQGIQDIFKGIFDALVGIVKTPVNLIIDIINGLIGGIVSGVNTAIKAINSLSFTMPDWLGGGTVGFSIPTLSAPKIPKLATGTVVPANYGEFLAVLGDNKRETEVVSPLSTLKQALAEVLAETGGGGKQEVVLKFDGSLSELARILKPALESEDSRVGVRLVTGGA